MAEYSDIIKQIVKNTEAAAKVPVYHAPAVSAGEKVIYRYTSGSYDGDFEHFTVTMRFISRDLAQAFARAMEVSRLLCGPGDRSVLSDDGSPVYTVREEGGTSGFIGRTGHYFVMTRFEVKRRLPSSVKLGIAVAE